MNKILKDVINRWKILQGFHCQYIPGWDCHGLPIELKALSKSKSREKDAIKIRQMSRAFAFEAIEHQKSEFKSWGVLGEWDKPYLTMEKDFVKAQLKLFYDLIQKKFIFRRYMPVYWSPSSKTALAESELEYNPNVNMNYIMQDKNKLFLVCQKLNQDFLSIFIAPKHCHIYKISCNIRNCARISSKIQEKSLFIIMDNDTMEHSSQ